MKRWAAVAVVLLAGCGGPEKSARVVVHQEHLEHPQGRRYIEGFLQFVEIRHPGDPDPVVLTEISLKPRELAIAPGTYTVVSYSRPCDSHCEEDLDPPRNRCRKRQVRIDGRLELTVKSMVGEDCAIS